MIILVDGYNVLFQIHGAQANDAQRSAFINLLGRYIQKRNHKLIVFFDGGTSPLQYQEVQKGITVFFSGQKKSADDVIIEYVQKHKGKHMIVVTLDRQLKNACGLYAPSLEPLVFYGRVQELLQPNPAHVKSDIVIRKMTDETDAMLDSLMYEAGLQRVHAKDEYEDQGSVKIVNKPPSKKQKIKDKILAML